MNTIAKIINLSNKVCGPLNLLIGFYTGSYATLFIGVVGIVAGYFYPLKLKDKKV